MTPTVPSFARVEIRLTEKADLASAATELRSLAGELDTIAGQKRSDEEAVILAHHKIRSTSKRTRK
jgi:hypothetical protein